MIMNNQVKRYSHHHGHIWGNGKLHGKIYVHWDIIQDDVKEMFEYGKAISSKKMNLLKGVKE